MSVLRALSVCCMLGVVSINNAQAEWIWVEGEAASRAQVTRHPWYTDIKQGAISGEGLLSHFDDNRAGAAEYRVVAPAAGEYDFWLRANPVLSQLRYSLNGGALTAIDLQAGQRDVVNIAGDNKPDLRFLAWVRVGRVPLKKGTNLLRFELISEKHHHGYIDCFVFTTESFEPRGARKPGETEIVDVEEGWFPFQPGSELVLDESVIDLRGLNEEFAGSRGRIIARDGRFVQSGTGEPVRFWGVNGPPEGLHGDDLARCARLLAKYGVNLVRMHGAVFNADGSPNAERIEHVHEVVEALKQEGIYTHLSIYFPLWFRPGPDLEWLPGYDGKRHPFATLFFNPEFQAKHREWMRALLTTPSKTTGATLLDEPAVLGIEIQNEDSLFFWTFSEANIPDPQLKMFERQFGDWVKKRYGSFDRAQRAWGGMPLKRDVPREGRLAFRPIWNLFNERTQRDQDTAEFLLSVQTEFYQKSYDWLRELGFQGLIHTSNWTTASPERLGALEKLSYTVGDFVDRHGYFSCNHKGENAAWSIRNGHTFRHRSALRFDPQEPGEPKQFVHPVMDPQYNELPSMISETTFTRPNRYRSEAPLYYAAYGALQDSDAIVHFAFDGAQWEVKPRYWMQQWTIASPAMMAQFPVAALLYREGLVAEGDLLADVRLARQNLLKLEECPLPQSAAFDELRLQDVPTGTTLSAGQRVDPLIHYAGRTQITFTENEPQRVSLKPLASLIDHNAQTVRSSSGELLLDYGSGLLKIDAPRVQGVSGALEQGGRMELRDVVIESTMELGHIVAVTLDDAPLATSRRILLQVMSEEKTSGFSTEQAGDGALRITDIGRDPWQVREFAGQVRFRRGDADSLTVTRLDLQGAPVEAQGTARAFSLDSRTMYYLIAPQ